MTLPSTVGDIPETVDGSFYGEGIHVHNQWKTRLSNLTLVLVIHVNQVDSAS